MKDIHVVGEKRARKGWKTAIYQSQILVISLYIELINKSSLKSTRFQGRVQQNCQMSHEVCSSVTESLMTSYVVNFQDRW